MKSCQECINAEEFNDGQSINCTALEDLEQEMTTINQNEYESIASICKHHEERDGR